MIRTKTLSLPLVSAMLASAVAPAVADVALTLSTQKTYRQDITGATEFRGGRFDISLRDGNGIYVGGCARENYWPPNVPLDPCPGGSTAFILYGDPDPDIPNAGPYFWMTEVIPALIIEPRRPDLCLLFAAPASKLKRPYGGFKDSSYGLYYNLHEANVTESVITRYDKNSVYSAAERNKFDQEIVPGVYHYSFPRLNYPVLKVPISPVIYPMPEGFAKVNNQKTGVQFIANDAAWFKNGFMELSYVRPNVVQWKGFSPTVVFPAVDSLYFSMRFLSEPTDPRSDTTNYDQKRLESPASFFPPYVSGGDPRVLLANPFVTSFTLPPVFLGGSRAVIQLDFERNFQTGGVTFDFSRRKFQIPVIIVNRYTEYADLRFGSATKNVAILDDYDNDGFNNLTEWILESRAEDPTSVPKPPLPADHAPVFNANGILLDPFYYGFTVIKKQGTRPNVKEVLQVSKNNGKTWKVMVTNADWLVTETPGQIRVESKTFAQPVGTLGDLYRVKVTLPK